MGGIVMPTNISRLFERDMIEARQLRLAWRLNKKMEPTEIGWAYVSKGDFPHYKKVIDAYFSFGGRHKTPRLDFFGSIVDIRSGVAGIAAKAARLGSTAKSIFIASASLAAIGTSYSTSI